MDKVLLDDSPNYRNTFINEPNNNSDLFNQQRERKNTEEVKVGEGKTQLGQ